MDPKEEKNLEIVIQIVVLSASSISLLYRSPLEDGCHVSSPKTPHNNVYRCLRERHGVCMPWLHVARVFSSCCWSLERQREAGAVYLAITKNQCP